MKEFLITKFNNKTCGILLDDFKFQEVRVYEEESRLGNIYLGRVSNVLTNINSCFVDIASGETCYMCLDDMITEGVPKVGDTFLVEFKKEGVGDKKPTVSGKYTIAGSYVAIGYNSGVNISSKITDSKVKERLKEAVKKAFKEFRITHDIPKTDFCYGAVVRTAAENVSSEVIAQEVNEILSKLDDIKAHSDYYKPCTCVYRKTPEIELDIESMIAKDIQVVSDIESILDTYKDKVQPVDGDTNVIYNINKQFEKNFNRNVYLKSGAYLVIDPTEAMTVIDVNSGQAIKQSKSREGMLKLNLEAAEEIARQLRIRNLGGIIMIDFISMKSKEDEQVLIDSLKQFVSSDYIRVKVIDITGLGIVEMTRKKTKKPNKEALGLK